MLYDGVERRIRRVEVIGASTNGDVDNAARKGAFWTDNDLRGLEKDLLLGLASDIDDLHLVYELLPCSFCNAKSAPQVLGLFVNGSETRNGQAVEIQAFNIVVAQTVWEQWGRKELFLERASHSQQV